MISRTYQVDDVLYKGFNRDYKGSEMDLVALVNVEGSIEVFVLDDTKLARTEFVRFLAEQDYYSNATVPGIYKRAK
jgi:hypothetical protein